MFQMSQNFSKPFVIQGFEASLVNFVLNLTSWALRFEEDLKMKKKLLNSSIGFSWFLVKFSWKFVAR